MLRHNKDLMNERKRINRASDKRKAKAQNRHAEGKKNVKLAGSKLYE